MGETSEQQPDKKPAKWSPFRLFEWKDSHPSESRRRITQNLISGLVLAAITAIGGILWSHKDIMARFAHWLVVLLQSSIQLQLWILLLVMIMLFGFAWIIYWIRGKFIKITELESKIKALTPRSTEEILNEIAKRNRLLPNLITKSVFYPRIDPTEDDRHGRRPYIHIEAANDSQRPIILTQLVVEYDDGHWRGSYVYNQDQEDKMAGVRLNDQEKYEVGQDDFQFLVVNNETGEGARDFWFLDTLGNKHPITDIKANLERYWAQSK
jgi:hypothetical protein